MVADWNDRFLVNWISNEHENLVRLCIAAFRISANDFTIHVRLCSVHLIGDVFTFLQKKFLFSSPMENGVAFLVRPKRKPVEGVAAGTSVNPFHSRDPILSLYTRKWCVILNFLSDWIFLKFALVSFFEDKQKGSNWRSSPIWNPSHYDIWSRTKSFYKLICYFPFTKTRAIWYENLEKLKSESAIQTLSSSI